MGEFWEKPKLGPLSVSWKFPFCCCDPTGSLKGMQDGAPRVYKHKSTELPPWEGAGIGNVLPRQAQHTQAGPKTPIFHLSLEKGMERIWSSAGKLRRGSRGWLSL